MFYMGTHPNNSKNDVDNLHYETTVSGTFSLSFSVLDVSSLKSTIIIIISWWVDFHVELFEFVKTIYLRPHMNPLVLNSEKITHGALLK